MNLVIIETADGSHTLFNAALNETYHSRHGARQESVHVYIEHGLKHRLAGTNRVRVLEVGFGTGLNIWLTALEALPRTEIQFFVHTVEPFPLSWDVIAATHLFTAHEHAALAQQMHSAPWNVPVQLLPNLQITKHSTPVLAAPLAHTFFDVIYFDAFAPEKQPEMWTPAVLTQMFEVLAPGGVLVTYCAKGQLKRDLRSCGFVVEALPGPPGKREMVRAVKPGP